MRQLFRLASITCYAKSGGLDSLHNCSLGQLPDMYRKPYRFDQSVPRRQFASLIGKKTVAPAHGALGLLEAKMESLSPFLYGSFIPYSMPVGG